jgi:uncharacterized damage-inducible protein DinB
LAHHAGTREIFPESDVPATPAAESSAAGVIYANHPMKDPLLRLVHHMRWADAVVADALEVDPNPDADALRLFGHIASVEHLWYSRIQGTPAAHPVWPNFTVAEARQVAAVHADLFEGLVQGADGERFARRVAYVNSAGRQYENTISDIVMHTAIHGEHHRGQIARLLRAAGREPPYTDYIQFARRDQ